MNHQTTPPMNNEILIIPDIHGRTFWKSALESGNYAKTIFLGDYTDPYQIERITDEATIDNFKSIIEYKSQHPDQVVLLLGNHDLHYVSDYFYKLAGSTRYNPTLAVTLHHLFQDHDQLFQLAWETNWGRKHYLFTHAGVTRKWFERNHDLIHKPDATHLNRLLHTKEGQEALAQIGKIRGGDYPGGSMVWADIEEMRASSPQPETYQIFGHTMQYDDPIITDTFACLDCRAAFSLHQTGTIKAVTEITSYEDVIYNSLNSSGKYF